MPPTVYFSVPAGYGQLAPVLGALLSAIPVLSDAVLAGENRDFVSALACMLYVDPVPAGVIAAGRTE